MVVFRELKMTAFVEMLPGGKVALIGPILLAARVGADLRRSASFIVQPVGHRKRHICRERCFLCEKATTKQGIRAKAPKVDVDIEVRQQLDGLGRKLQGPYRLLYLPCYA